MRVILAWILGIGLAINGLAMLGWPLAWYGTIPGVPETGPFNPHFVRDIGCASLVSGVALIWLTRRPQARPAAQAAAAFLGLHALVHFWDTLAGREHLHNFAADIPSVILPALLAIWIAWPRRAVIPT